MIKQNNGNIMVALLAVGLLVGVGVWYVITQRGVVSSESAPIVTPAESTIDASIDTSDWKTYTNEELGVSFKYPVEMEIIQTTPELKMMLSGPEQFDSPGFLDGLFLIMTGSGLDKTQLARDHLYAQLSSTYSEVAYEDIVDRDFDQKHGSYYSPGSPLDAYSHGVFVSIRVNEDSILNFYLAIGRNQRSYFDSIRNSIIDSIEFVE